MVRMRTTKGKRNTRRSQHGIAAVGSTQEGEVMRLRHHASRETGTYRGREVLDTVKRTQRLARRKSNESDEKRTEEQTAPPSAAL